MSAPIAIGDEAPNFDLTSTEDVVLMLRDEVPRTAVVLYFFADPADSRVRRDLEALGARAAALAALRAKALAVAPAPLAALKQLQRELSLPFPLLHDDRAKSAAYGVAPAAEGQAAPPVLAVVSRAQKILWLQNPAPPVAETMLELEKLLRGQPSPTALYPKSVINRWIDRWVN